MTRTPAVMEIELKSCPFCGSPAKMHYDGGSSAWVTCPNAECFVQPEGSSCHTEADAARLWNTRTPAEPLADGEMIEKVAEAIWRAEWVGGEPPYSSWAAMRVENHNAAETFLAQARAAIATYNPNDRLREALESLKALNQGVWGNDNLPMAQRNFAAKCIVKIDAALSHKD